MSTANDETMHCSFCKKTQHEVRKLIAGPDVFICDDCVDICATVMSEEGRDVAAKPGIEFAAGFADAAPGILAYFSECIRKRDPDGGASVSIRQVGRTIKMELRSGDGRSEVIERVIGEVC